MLWGESIYGKLPFWRKFLWSGWFLRGLNDIICKGSLVLINLCYNFLYRTHKSIGDLSQVNINIPEVFHFVPPLLSFDLSSFVSFSSFFLDFLEAAPFHPELKKISLSQQAILCIHLCFGVDIFTFMLSISYQQYYCSTIWPSSAKITLPFPLTYIFG